MPTIPDASFVSDGRSYIVPANSTHYHYLPSGNSAAVQHTYHQAQQERQVRPQVPAHDVVLATSGSLLREHRNWWDDQWGNNEEKYVPAVTWDNVYVAPWENAQVYWTDDWGSQ